MAKRKTGKVKEEVNIMGKTYKVQKAVADTLKQIAEALHAHEVALLTWVHKEYGKVKLKKDELKEFKESLRKYAMQIPESENILVRMQEIDDQMREDIKKAKETEQNKDKKGEGAKE